MAGICRHREKKLKIKTSAAARTKCRPRWFVGKSGRRKKRKVHTCPAGMIDSATRTECCVRPCNLGGAPLFLAKPVQGCVSQGAVAVHTCIEQVLYTPKNAPRNLRR